MNLLIFSQSDEGHSEDLKPPAVLHSLGVINQNMQIIFKYLFNKENMNDH